jgi:hypothetical protein
LFPVSYGFSFPALRVTLFLLGYLFDWLDEPALAHGLVKANVALAVLKGILKKFKSLGVCGHLLGELV